MFEGLFAALALFFSPHADEVRAPEPLVSIDMITGTPPRPDGRPRPEPIFVSVMGGGALYLNEASQRIETLGEALRKGDACNAEGDCQRIYIRADEDVSYTDVLSTISALKHNGFTRIGLIDESSS